MTATYTLNAERNGVEIRFDSKPAAAVLDILKAAGYRWSRARRIWWAHQSPKALETAQAVTEGHMKEQATQDTAPALDLWERTRWTPGPGGDECHAHTVGSNYTRGMSNKEIAATVKRHLTQRFPGTKWSATTQGYNSIDLYLKASPYHNERHYETRREWAEKSPELSAILQYAESLLNSYNYNNSDTMTDYFDVNFYDSVGVCYDYQQTEPTEAQRAEIEQFRARMEEEKRNEEERREQEWQEEQARRAIEADFAALDRLGVPYIVQNAATGAGSRNKGTRPTFFLVRDIMDKYAHRLTPEARQEWRIFAQEQRDADKHSEIIPL